MKVKPIVFIKYPIDMSEEDVYQSTKIVSDEIGDDYYVISFFSLTNDLEIEVFYEKDFTQVKFDELKEMIQNNMK